MECIPKSKSAVAQFFKMNALCLIHFSQLSTQKNNPICQCSWNLVIVIEGHRLSSPQLFHICMIEQRFTHIIVLFTKQWSLLHWQKILNSSFLGSLVFFITGTFQLAKNTLKNWSNNASDERLKKIPDRGKMYTLVAKSLTPEAGKPWQKW